ncbi:MAG: hypothetical protein DHS20C02_01300 [Micavibrio sp.]|nr:MAG: hypothetical protein DHS20C02_01300 [Micavibrio sp.]
MSSDIVLTAALRSNLLSLQSTQRLIDTTQLRLATGLKVNSALDNPQNFFAAQSLNNRANDLSRLLDGIGQSIRTIEEADNGVTALTNLIEQAESVATEAQSEIRSAEGFARIRGSEDLVGIDLEGDLAAITDGASDLFTVTFRGTINSTVVTQTVTVDIDPGQTVDDIVAQINSSTSVGVNNAANGQLIQARITSGGQIQLESLIEGGFVRVADATASGIGAAGFSALGLDTVVGAEADEATSAATRQAGTAVAGRVITSLASGNATGPGGEFEASQLLGAGGTDANFIAAGDTVDIRVVVDGQASAAITLADTNEIQDLLDGINNDGTVGSIVTASLNTETGQIELLAGDNVGTLELRVEGTAGGEVTTFGFGTGASDVVAPAAGADNSELFTFVGTSANLDQFESDYNTIRAQIDDIVEDAQFRGVNLLNGDNLVTFFNEDRNNSLETQGVDFTALGLGIAVGDFTNATEVQISIDQSRAALLDVRNFGQSIANDLAIIQTRRDFTEATINTLTAGADDLTVADQNEEGANLLALQTRQALGTTSLSLAAQSQQSVLRLF